MDVGTLSEKSDTELIGDVRHGSHCAASELVRRHRPWMYRLALRLTHDKQAADDLTREAFIQSFAKLQQFNHESTFANWLYRVTVNAAFMALRRRRSSKGSMLQDLEPDGGTCSRDPTDTRRPATDGVAIAHLPAANIAKAMGASPEAYPSALPVRTCVDAGFTAAFADARSPRVRAS